jgi:hypothetical protein
MSARPDDTSAAEAKVAEAAAILSAIDFPLGKDEFRTKLRQDRICHILLAVADLTPTASWKSAKVHGSGKESHAPRSRDIIIFLNKHYGTTISPGSYDDIRRKNLDFLVEAGIVVPSARREGASTNDGTRGYAIRKDAQRLLQGYGTRIWPAIVEQFRKTHASLSTALQRPANKRMVEVTFPDGQTYQLSTGPHNRIQKSVIEEFLPRFAEKPRILYLGDTAKKDLVVDRPRLEALGLDLNQHDRLPDIIVLDEARNWLFLIEAVHSSNPVSPLRHLALERLTAKCKLGKVFVSAFEDLKSFAKWAPGISWETEIWVADNPTHMIHYNGDRFYGPRER